MQPWWTLILRRIGTMLVETSCNPHAGYLQMSRKNKIPMAAA